MSTEEGSLYSLAGQARHLTAAVRAYQRALLDARLAGASWQQIGDAAGCSKGAVRSQHRATTEHGGEMHVRLEPIREAESNAR
jgi:hypothetical protein